MYRSEPFIRCQRDTSLDDMLYRLWLNFELLAHSGRQIKHLSMDKYWELLLTLLLIFLASVLRPWQRIKLIKTSTKTR